MAPAVMTISANAEITTAAAGTMVLNIQNTTIAIPRNENIIARIAWSCSVFPNEEPI